MARDKTPRTEAAFKENDERWTETAIKISNEFDAAIRPIFEKYYAQGFKARELSHLLMGVAWENELMTVL
jgi:hypothetical protein